MTKQQEIAAFKRFIASIVKLTGKKTSQIIEEGLEATYLHRFVEMAPQIVSNIENDIEPEVNVFVTHENFENSKQALQDHYSELVANLEAQIESKNREIQEQSHYDIRVLHEKRRKLEADVARGSEIISREQSAIAEARKEHEKISRLLTGSSESEA